MSEKKGLLVRRSHEAKEPYRILKERLVGTNIELTCFLFHHGGNIYVLSYEKGGVRRHTLIDTGDLRYRNQISSILIENEINPANIEGIFITHRHPDHSGLASLLAKESGAKILVHANFRAFVEGKISQEERRWLGNYDISQLRDCNIEYLPELDRNKSINIGGVLFPRLAEPMKIGETSKLTILACPESVHSPDQIVVLYSRRDFSQAYEKKQEDFRPTDDILFSGDLWLMRGPLDGWSVEDLSPYLKEFPQLKDLLSNKGKLWRDFREQDFEAKEALKRGFCIIRVKPGHGEEFTGSRIIPKSLLAGRELLMELGYSPNTDETILKSEELAPRIAAIMEQAYANFVKELLLWRELGYTLNEVSELLVRIYREQSGGGPLVEKDRKQRRRRLKTTLARLRDDKARASELHELAELTLSELKRVK